MQMQTEKINILLVGKTGNGKSATGNSILRRKVFRNLASTSPVTRELQMNYSEHNGKCIKVVDTPGINSSADMNARLEETIKKAKIICPEGYDAIIIVVKFNGQFNGEETKILNHLKSLLGDEFIMTRCFAIMTHGDIFEYDDFVDFNNWCSNQDAEHFKTLYDNCSRNLILFNNKAKENTKLISQLENVLKCVNFSQHGSAAQIKAPEESEEYLKESSLIVEQLMSIDLTDTKLSETLGRLELLIKRADRLLLSLKNEPKDKASSNLRKLIGNTINIKNAIEDQILSTKDAQELPDERVTSSGSDQETMVQRMTQRLREDARRVEEENIEILKDWTESHISKGFDH